jgi:hypothetical protein
VFLNEDNEIELFKNDINNDNVKIVQDNSLNQDMILSCRDNEICYFKNNVLFSFAMK